MATHSLIRSHQGELIPVTIQATLLPGLPQIHILGVPNAGTKESSLRLRSALKNQGFDFPKGKQILIQIFPFQERRLSVGLDLAMAIEILTVTGQLDQKWQGFQDFLVCGDVDLLGHVRAVPLPLEGENYLMNKLLTGNGAAAHTSLTTWSIDQLCCLKNNRALSQSYEAGPIIIESKGFQVEWIRPEIPNLSYDDETAQFLMTSALGHHSTLLCGPKGSGKTTMAEMIVTLMEPPDFESTQEMLRVSRWFGKIPRWRPFVRPHHSLSAKALVGGGIPLVPGEITRAHTGVLFLDELLEFDPKVQDSLREPLEEGRITLRKGHHWSEFPAKFQLIGATNLCQCGDYSPLEPEVCPCPPKIISKYRNRISGPLLDRMDMIWYTSKKKENDRAHTLQSLLSKLQECRDFQLEQKRKSIKCSTPKTMNSKQDLFLYLDYRQQDLKLYEMGLNESFRRRKAFLKVAQTIACLDLSETIQSRHFEQAFEWTVRSLAVMWNPEPQLFLKLDRKNRIKKSSCTQALHGLKEQGTKLS